MFFLLIILVVIILTNWHILKQYLNKRIKITQRINKKIDEEIIQNIVSSITNGLNPRNVLSNIARINNFIELSKASATGDDLVEAIKIDTNNDLTSVSFAQVWQGCEKNGASLSPVLSSFNKQIRTENELRQELSSSLAGVKLSAYVLAFLPFIGIFLAFILGVNSINWLANSSFGKISLAFAFILEFVGIIWVRKLVNQVESLL